ncbi:MAG: hypothetical protein D6683_16825, partial [Actinomyces sp.]
RTSPEAVAGVLVSTLAHVAAHRRGLVEAGIDGEDLAVTLARVVEWSLGRGGDRDHDAHDDSRGDRDHDAHDDSCGDRDHDAHDDSRGDRDHDPGQDSGGDRDR